MTHINTARARQWREHMGYTQSGLARALGVSLRHVQGMESGARSDGKPIGAQEWQRYTLLCAGLTHLQGRAPESWVWVEG